jgi:mannose-6-phosphate isomerase-like protein (cupin superfamily)
MLSLLMLMVVAGGPQTTPPARPQTAPPAGPQATPPARRPVAAGATVEIRVSDRMGNPLTGAMVAAEGPSSRESSTDTEGRATFRTLTAGTYRVRAVREGFITLEKEVAVRVAPLPTIEFSLSAAPPPPSPPPPPPPPPVQAVASPAPPPVEPGEPRLVDVPALAEKSLGGREPLRMLSIGCSGHTAAQLIVVRDAIPTAAHPNRDEMLYVVAGEATLNLGQKAQAIAPGWLSVVPRGTSYALTRKGRNPVVLLSFVGGPPCAEGVTASPQ